MNCIKSAGLVYAHPHLECTVRMAECELHKFVAHVPHGNLQRSLGVLAWCVNDAGRYSSSRVHEVVRAPFISSVTLPPITLRSDPARGLEQLQGDLPQVLQC
jgi:hypothetical protein